MNFKEYITKEMGYEPRQIDLANMLGEVRGELVGKWFRGAAFPDKENIQKLSKVLGIHPREIYKKIAEIKSEMYEN